jgi:DNA-binding NarL/FixJ family response regulator
MKNISVLIADDHPLYRSGIKMVVDALPDVGSVTEAKDGMEAYQAIVALKPDIAILDVEMPLLSGIDVCKKVLAEKHYTKIIVLTMHRERHFFEDAMKSGVSGYLLKDGASQELKKCIEVVCAGERFVSDALHNLTAGLEQAASLLNQLTPTERIILKLIGEGKTTNEIGKLLFVSPKTIENHRTNISKKLDLGGTQNALLKFALQYNAG